MALDLLGSITRDRIVASAWMIGHRQIQVIEFADGRLCPESEVRLRLPEWLGVAGDGRGMSRCQSIGDSRGWRQTRTDAGKVRAN
jgi:hypothetical protein